MLCSSRLTSSSWQRDCRSPWKGAHSHCRSLELFLAHHANRCWGASFQMHWVCAIQGNDASPGTNPGIPPRPNRPWDVVSIDLLQLPSSHQGSKYLLVCVNHLSRYVVLGSSKDKSVKSVAHALIINLFSPYSSPRVLLSNNGAEFCNTLLEETSQQYGIKQCFNLSSSHQRPRRACINNWPCESTGQYPHFILLGDVFEVYHVESLFFG